MNIKTVLSRYSTDFFLMSIVLTITAILVTLIITIKSYIWNIPIEFDIIAPIDYFLIDNHSYIMTTVLIISGFSSLVHRIGFDLKIHWKGLRLIHGFLNFITLALAMCPIYSLIISFSRNRIAIAFYSIHVWVGVITLLALTIQFFVAIVYYSLPLITKRLTTKFKSIHKGVGYGIFCMVCLSAILGISEKNHNYFKKFPGHFTRVLYLPNLMAISVIGFTLCIIYLIYSRRKLETALFGIKTKQYNERQKFLMKVMEIQKKKRPKP